MGKRLIRIPAKDIPSKISSVVSKEINIVMHDKTTLFGSLVSADDQKLLLKDTRLDLHPIDFKNIREIIYDYTASF
jgi:hypothetical protein